MSSSYSNCGVAFQAGFALSLHQTPLIKKSLKTKLCSLFRICLHGGQYGIETFGYSILGNSVCGEVVTQLLGHDPRQFEVL
jgi:hypothetical protein